jgi:hypothetical protein
MLQLKPNQWSCAITSLAMTLRVPTQELIDELGHDGSAIVFPQLIEPMCRRGFHSQELIHLAWRHGFAVTPIELFPTIRPMQGEGTHIVRFGGDDGSMNLGRFIDTIHSNIGILEGQSGRWMHAVHFRYGEIYDPDGYQYLYSKRGCQGTGFIPNRAHVFTSRM